METTDLSAERTRINLSWLIKLRWAAFVGQLATVAFVYGVLQVSAPAAPLVVVVCLAGLSNLPLQWWSEHVQRPDRWPQSARLAERLIRVVVASDILILTVLLGLSGGPNNPFAIFYFANLTLGAVFFPRTSAWTMTGLAVVCYGVLFLRSAPVPELSEHGVDGRYRLPGMFAAFITAAPVIVYFTSRVTRALAQRELDLAEARHKQARMEKLQALGTLAAGAAHELSSPLATIAVVAKELVLSLERGQQSADAVEDAQLIREEVNRCRTILHQMAADAGQHAGEGLQRVTVAELAPAILDGCRDPDRVQLTVDPAASDAVLLAPRHLLAQSLRGLVNNAIDASASEAPVEMEIARAGDRVTVEVRDLGHGMDPGVLARAGEPFFTTKEVGKGMGLGLFLARTVVERLEGTLDLTSRPQGGTLARVELPVANHA
jgi:two-component system sensor histidine kinase RegB